MVLQTLVEGPEGQLMVSPASPHRTACAAAHRPACKPACTRQSASQPAQVSRAGLCQPLPARLALPAQRAAPAAQPPLRPSPRSGQPRRPNPHSAPPSPPAPAPPRPPAPRAAPSLQVSTSVGAKKPKLLTTSGQEIPIYQYDVVAGDAIVHTIKGVSPAWLRCTAGRALLAGSAVCSPRRQQARRSARMSAVHVRGSGLLLLTSPARRPPRRDHACQPPLGSPFPRPLTLPLHPPPPPPQPPRRCSCPARCPWAPSPPAPPRLALRHAHTASCLCGAFPGPLLGCKVDMHRQHRPGAPCGGASQRFDISPPASPRRGPPPLTQSQLYRDCCTRQRRRPERQPAAVRRRSRVLSGARSWPWE